MGALCTACQKLTRLVFQSERNAMFLLCLAGMITLRNHTKNLAKHIFFGAVITSLAQELFMSSWKSPERGSNMLRIKCLRMKKTCSSKLANGDIKCFWKKVRKYNSGNVANSNRIENETGSQNITNMWHDHYKQLFNSVNDTDDKPYVLSYIRNNLDTTDAVVTVYDTICAIKKLPNNKSPGYDGLMSEHFSLHHIVCMSWWQLFYSLWWNRVFFLNNLWQLCLFQLWKTRMVTLQANQIIGQLLCLQWHPKSWR